MSFEDAEEIYKQEKEYLEKEFIEGVKKKANFKELEKNYKSKVKLSREKYYLRISEELEKQKKANAKKKKPSIKREKTKSFRIKSRNLDLNVFQKLKFKIGLISFKVSFKMRNYVRKKTPFFISYNLIKIRIKIKRFIVQLKDLIEKFTKRTKEFFQKLFRTNKELAIKIYKLTVKLFWKIVGKFRKKKEKSKDKDGKPLNKEESENKESKNEKS